jgi:Fur family ferric uptake transcriptional regulator
MKSQQIEEYIIEHFNNSGYKLTEPRKRLIERIASFNTHPFTSEDLARSVQDDQIGRATLFRTLKLLLDSNILTRHYTLDGYSCYLLSIQSDHPQSSHQDRLVCKECSRVVYLDDCPISHSLWQIAQDLGYQLESHLVSIMGVCRECQKKKKVQK